MSNDNTSVIDWLLDGGYDRGSKNKTRNKPQPRALTREEREYHQRVLDADNKRIKQEEKGK